MFRLIRDDNGLGKIIDQFPKPYTCLFNGKEYRKEGIRRTWEGPEGHKNLILGNDSNK